MNRPGATTRPQAAGDRFTAEERRRLLDLARRTLKEVVATGKQPGFHPADLPGKFLEPEGCFVTLTKGGALRGCIGNITPCGPLFRSVMRNVKNAAMHDSRFLPVDPSEVDGIEIEISVLTEPRPLAFDSPDDLLAKLRPREDGVMLRIGSRGATYLPQVWEKLPDKAAFLDSLAEKAGCAPAAWRGPGAAVFTYRAECFSESGHSEAHHG